MPIGPIQNAMTSLASQRSEQLANQARLIQSMADSQHQAVMGQIAMENMLYEIQKDKKLQEQQSRIADMKFQIAKEGLDLQKQEAMREALNGFAKGLGDKIAAVVNLDKVEEYLKANFPTIFSQSAGISPNGASRLGANEVIRQDNRLKTELAKSRMVELGISEQQRDEIARKMKSFKSAAYKAMTDGREKDLREASRRAKEVVNTIPAEVRNNLQAGPFKPGISVRRGIENQLAALDRIANLEVKSGGFADPSKRFATHSYSLDALADEYSRMYPGEVRALEEAGLRAEPETSTISKIGNVAAHGIAGPYGWLAGASRLASHFGTPYGKSLYHGVPYGQPPEMGSQLERKIGQVQQRREMMTPGEEMSNIPLQAESAIREMQSLFRR